MEREQKKILVAVDGSEQTLAMVDYLSTMVSPVDVEIVLFHVMSKVPESFRDWEKDPVVPMRQESLGKWEADREEKIRDFMRRLRRMLVDSGVPEYSVMISIQKLREGIARDIIVEAGRGYDAVLVGRTGMRRRQPVHRKHRDQDRGKARGRERVAGRRRTSQRENPHPR